MVQVHLGPRTRPSEDPASRGVFAFPGQGHRRTDAPGGRVRYADAWLGSVAMCREST
jgi:hypothetical protein